MIDQTISHYKILEKLGAGGVGVVYKADDLTLKRPVALKFLYGSMAHDAEGRSRFLREARAAAALEHPNITTIYETGETKQGEMFIAMAYVDGQTLKEEIQAAPLSVEEALDIAIPIAQGLNEAHDKGIVHRDVKSANIMVTSKGQVKITDFGLARFSRERSITKKGGQLGTARYMSPEQIQGKPADHQSDLFSFGVVLYEMLTGTLPFKGEHDQAVMFSILYDQPPPVRQLRPEVPEALQRIVEKALQKNKGQRYQHTDALLADLQACKGGTASGPGAIGSRASAKRNMVPFLYGSLAILLMVLVYSGVQFFSGSTETGTIDSIAVLPLNNLSDDPGQEYFVQGMQEALISDLSKINALKVISRTSTMRYKETPKAIPEIARELDVDALIEGSVFRVHDEVRITVQLIHGATDNHVWEGTYDRDLRNVLALISEVAQAVADEIEVVVTPEEEAHLTRARLVNPKAHTAYLKGNYFMTQFTGQGFRRALSYYQEAITIDSSFALGWAGLGGAHALLAYAGNAPAGEAIAQARNAASKAIALNDRVADAHTVLGWTRLWDWDWPGAHSAFQKALALSPNDVNALHGYGDCLTITGRLDEGLVYVRRSGENDPFSPLYGVPVAAHLYMMRRYDDAIAEIQKLQELDPDYPVHQWLARIYWQKGMYDEATVAYRNAWRRDPERVEALEQGYAAAGPPGAMHAVASLLVTRSEERYVDPFSIAAAFASAAEVDRALAWLERAYEERTPEMIYVNLRPEFDPVRSDPRFQDLLHRIGLLEDGNPDVL